MPDALLDFPQAAPTVSPARVRIWVPGVPAPGGSKTATLIRRKGGEIVTVNGRPLITTREDGKGNKEWRAVVSCAAAAAMGAASPLAGPLAVRVVLVMPRPKGHFGARGLLPSAPGRPAKKPDATKLWRSTEDACTGIVWVDDAQIVSQFVAKVYGDRPGAWVEVWAAGDGMEPDLHAAITEGGQP